MNIEDHLEDAISECNKVFAILNAMNIGKRKIEKEDRENLIWIAEEHIERLKVKLDKITIS